MTTLPKVSERLGKQEQVGRGVVRRQLGAALRRRRSARPDAPPASAAARRAVADDDHAQRPGGAPRARSNARSAELDVLLGGDAADHEQHRRVVVGPPLRGAARRCGAPARSARCRRRGRPRSGCGSRRRRARARAARVGTKVRSGQVVEPAQQAEHRRREERRGRSSGCTGGNWCGSRRSSAMPSAPRRGERRPGAAARASPGGPARAGSLGSAAPAGRRAPGRSADRGTSGSRSRRCAARRRRRARASPGWRGRISSTMWPRARRKRTVRSTVSETPFSSGG